MTTTHLVIVCVAALAALVIARSALVELGRQRLATARDATNAQLAVRRLELAREAAADDENAPPSRVGHRVTVHTKKPDDQTIFGVVVGDFPDRISLDPAEYVTPTGPQPMTGRQDFATRDVAWIDVHALVTSPVPAAAAAGDR